MMIIYFVLRACHSYAPRDDEWKSTCIKTILVLAPHVSVFVCVRASEWVRLCVRVCLHILRSKMAAIGHSFSTFVYYWARQASDTHTHPTSLAHRIHTFCGCWLHWTASNGNGTIYYTYYYYIYDGNIFENSMYHIRFSSLVAAIAATAVSGSYSTYFVVQNQNINNLNNTQKNVTYWHISKRFSMHASMAPAAAAAQQLHRNAVMLLRIHWPNAGGDGRRRR